MGLSGISQVLGTSWEATQGRFEIKTKTGNELVPTEEAIKEIEGNEEKSCWRTGRFKTAVQVLYIEIRKKFV